MGYCLWGENPRDKIYNFPKIKHGKYGKKRVLKFYKILVRALADLKKNIFKTFMINVKTG